MKHRPAPPPDVVKHVVIKRYSARYARSVFIETGTLYGDTIRSVSRRFEHCYSIELSENLYRKGLERFAGSPNVTLLHGDSGTVLPSLLARIDVPAILWLDGHYSGGETASGEAVSPVLRELDAIFAHRDDHVILVDDARVFGQSGYPSLSATYDLVRRRAPTAEISVAHDIVRIVPEGSRH